MSWKITIISGGQTGAGRAALDFAIKNEIPYGGWCPKGRCALDGPLASEYQLRETPSDEYLERAEWNVRDSDATVVFTLSEKTSGIWKKTLSLAKKQKKSCVHFHRGILAVAEKLLQFCQKHEVRRLHIAGSNEDAEAGIYEWVLATLEKAKATAEYQSKFGFHHAYHERAQR